MYIGYVGSIAFLLYSHADGEKYGKVRSIFWLLNDPLQGCIQNFFSGGRGGKQLRRCYPVP